MTKHAGFSTLALLMMLLSSGCTEVVPGIVRQDARTGLIQSEFTFIKDPYKGVLSDMTGGACLVAHAADINEGLSFGLNTTCSSQADCPQVLGNWFGYCHADLGDTQGTCWYRPGGTKKFCNRSIDSETVGLNWTLGVTNPAPIEPVSISHLGRPRDIRFRNVSCMNTRHILSGTPTTNCPHKVFSDVTVLRIP